jgi:hypothetical protein
MSVHYSLILITLSSAPCDTEVRVSEVENLFHFLGSLRIVNNPIIGI